MSCTACDNGQPCTGPDITYRADCSDGSCALPNPTSEYPETGEIATAADKRAAERARMEAMTAQAYEDGVAVGGRGTLFAGALGLGLGAALLYSAVRWGLVKG